VPTPAGSGNGTITAYFIINETNQQRIATILVTVNGLTPIPVTVTQDASTVNIAEPSAESIRIYPNPTKGIFNIIPAEGEKVSMKITVQDLNGKVLLEKTCKDKKEYQLDLTTAPDGTYNIIIKACDCKIILFRLERLFICVYPWNCSQQFFGIIVLGMSIDTVRISDFHDLS
jgi:hypothetical protein